MRCRLAALVLLPVLALPTALEAGIAPGLHRPSRDAATRVRARQAAAPAGRSGGRPPARAAQAVSSFDAEQTRQQLETLMRQYPPSLSDVLRNDPSLLTNDHYLATYPVLAGFLGEHPEIAHNPAFFIGTNQGRSWNDDSPQIQAIRAWQDMVQGIQIITVVGIITGAFIWIIRTLLDYRRWLRVTRVQAEVHGKLLDQVCVERGPALLHPDTGRVGSSWSRRRFRSTPTCRARSARPSTGSCGRCRPASSSRRARSACSTSAAVRFRRLAGRSSRWAASAWRSAPGLWFRRWSRIFCLDGSGSSRIGPRPQRPTSITPWRCAT